MRMHRIILAISILVILPAFAPPAFTAALNGSNNCGSCHGSFNPFKFSFDAPKEAPLGEEIDFALGIKNPWAHHVSNLSVVFSLQDAPGLAFSGTKAPLLENVSGTVGLLAQKNEKPFAMSGNATRLTAALEGNGGIHGLNNLDLMIIAPSGRQWASSSSGASESIVVEQADISIGGCGEWKVVVSWIYGDPEVAYSLRITVEYSSELRQRSVFIGNLAPGEEKGASWRLLCIGKGENNISIMGRCHVHYDHSDATIADDADCERTGRFRILVSDSYSDSSENESGGWLVWLESQSMLLGRTTGFAALALIIASVITGGFPGSKAKMRLNRIFGGAVRRIKFHFWISVALIALSIMHGAILLIGFYYGTFAGLALGGISLGAMLGTSITGYFHIPIVKKIGHRRWHEIHLSLAVAALLFGLLHAFIDGTTLPRLLGY